MRLVQFEWSGAKKVGVEVAEDGDVINLSDAGEAFPNTMVEFLAGGDKLMKNAKEIFNEGTSNPISRSHINILAPITTPGKVVCIGLNYKDHCLENNVPVPTEPVVFNKFPSSIIGPACAIKIPKISNALDWEAELAVVIGRGGKNIQATVAMDHVAGYVVANDVTARDWYKIKNGGQVLLAKSCDTFCPLGPALVTKDSVPDPHKLSIRCQVNDVVMQDSCTDQLVFNINDCIAWISKFFELKPGDVMLTGSPPGSGAFRKPPIYLKSGDVVTCEIDGIGKISNPVIPE